MTIFSASKIFFFSIFVNLKYNIHFLYEKKIYFHSISRKFASWVFQQAITQIPLRQGQIYDSNLITGLIDKDHKCESKTSLYLKRYGSAGGVCIDIEKEKESSFLSAVFYDITQFHMFSLLEHFKCKKTFQYVLKLFGALYSSKIRYL